MLTSNQAPALCGLHCVVRSALDISNETLYGEYWVQRPDESHGYLLLSSGGIGFGRETDGAGKLEESTHGKNATRERFILFFFLCVCNDDSFFFFPGAPEVFFRAKWKDVTFKSFDPPQMFAVSLSVWQQPDFVCVYRTVAERNAFLTLLEKTKSEELEKISALKRDITSVKIHHKE